MAPARISIDAEDPLPADATQRRRIQNRIAQRKFRQKRTLKRKLENNEMDLLDKQGADNNDGQGPLSVGFDVGCFGSAIDTATHSDPLADHDSLLPDFLEVSQEGFSCFEPQRPLTEIALPACELSRSSSGKTRYNGDALGQHRYRTQRKRSHSASTLDEWLTALHIAAERGHARILNMLLKRETFSVDDEDGEGKTALHYATINEHEDCVRVLLDHGAKANCGDLLTGWTSIHWAVLTNNEDILRTLLEHASKDEDFDIDAFDVNGWTALHAAVERGFEEGVTLLLEHGANLSFRAIRCKITGAAIPKDVEDIIRAAQKDQRAAAEATQFGFEPL